RDSVSVYQLAAPASYILASPRADTVLYSGGSVTFNITAVDLVSAWVVDESTLPPWIQDYNIVNDSTLVFNVQANTSPSTLHTTIRITDAGNILTRDSISVYQYAAPEKYVLVAPREQKIIHNGGELIFEITAVNVDNWGVDILTLPDWVSDFDVIGNLLSLTIEANLSLETRETSIRIFADSAASTLEDFVSVYQYSGLDHYLLASPRERKTGNLADTLYFWVDTVNVSNWQAEVLAGDSLWIETFINGADTLGLIISENMDTVARQGRVKIFSAQFPDAEDIVDIYQYSPFEPFIIIDPSFERFSSLKDSLVIYSFSNLENYTIGQAPNLPNPTWYKLSKLIAHFNDSVTITVDSNDNGYYGRTSYLTFRSIDSSFINYFYFQQRKNSFNFIEISGTVAIEGEDQLPLDSTAIIIETDTIYTNQAGYFNYEVPYGWVGIIRPEKPGYFFDPPNAVFNNQQTESIDTSFTALKIEPDITFNNQGDTLPICKGEQIDNTSANYPTIGISGTFGARGYKWFSEPADPNLITDSTSSPAVQIFAPATTTTYYLVLYNYNTSDTTWFTVLINPPPETRRIEGAHAVCRNQAGVIYSVHDFKPDEYFFWQLYFEGELIDSYTSNIAVIDFQGAAGKYQLKLTTFNNFGCSISNTDTITVSTDEAPPKAAITRKEGDNMLICIDSDAQLYNYEWGWYTLSTSGALNNKYIIPDRHDWYCRLPDNHNFDPITYKYFVSLSFKNGNGCASVSFLDGNAPIGIPEDNGKAYTIFPNPANGVISIKFSALTGNEPVNFQILNTAGQTLFSKSWNKIPSSEAFLIEETQRLQPGLYFFRAEIGGKFYNSKIVVQ
ncbi:MAG: T9SS type A sorting domain-containing protein, partial [Bacteroidales bacterium]|nr:T9SS type A sorting domain-containing protein [Bacteroidales bacterium]